MRIEQHKLLARINCKYWWHVTPIDHLAYSKRGKFFSSTYAEAEFYGRPNEQPERVTVLRPLVGDNDSVERKLFGKVLSSGNISLDGRFALDARMKRVAMRKGYDAIVVLSRPGFLRFRHEGKLPRSMELNVLNPSRNVIPCCAHGKRSSRCAYA